MFAHLGPMLAHLGPMLRPSWGNVRPSWAYVGVTTVRGQASSPNPARRTSLQANWVPAIWQVSAWPCACSSFVFSSFCVLPRTRTSCRRLESQLSVSPGLILEWAHLLWKYRRYLGSLNWIRFSNLIWFFFSQNRWWWWWPVRQATTVGEEDLEDIPLSPVPLVYAAPVSQQMMGLFPSCILACPASFEVCIGEPTVIEGEGVQAGTVRLTPLRVETLIVAREPYVKKIILLMIFSKF